MQSKTWLHIYASDAPSATASGAPAYPLPSAPLCHFPIISLTPGATGLDVQATAEA